MPGEDRTVWLRPGGILWLGARAMTLSTAVAAPMACLARDRCGDDTLFGEGRADTLVGRGGSNEYFGASGADRILANESQTGETETVSAGPGNDTINADDTNIFGAERDIVDCGSGKDEVSADSADDIAANCEDVQLTSVSLE